MSVYLAARTEVTFASGRDSCSAWHYAGSNGACVVMATGAAITKEPGANRFAARFQAAGFSVLSFDYRRFGASGGTPRQVLRRREQVEDLKAAIAFAPRLPEVRADRVAAWGFSLGGGYVLEVASEMKLAAAIAQTPFVNGPAAAPNALRHETARVKLSFPFIALGDVLGGLTGRPPRLIPLTGPKGSVAMLTTPDAQDGPRALDPDGRYPDWTQAIAARSVMQLGLYRPGRKASRIACPLLVVAANEDQSVLAAPAVRAASKAPRSTLLRIPGGHYAPFMEQHEIVVSAEVAFLNRKLEPERN
jgi:dienelactone hydrolase